ncbi:MAG: SpoIIE family protein phosphatase [Lysobacterales bacterium]
MQEFDKKEILRNCSFLRGAGDEVLAGLGEHCATLRVDEGTTVVAKGDPGSTMYFIASGGVRVHDGDTELARLGGGEVFGEMAVLDSDVRSASVTAAEASTLLSLERDDLWRVISTSPEALQSVMAAVLQRERGIVEDVTARTRQVLAFEKELEIGRRIQADFLPEQLPDVEGWDIASTFEAAREVAGDFYDVFELKAIGRLAVVIGDVCDKGVGAALFMTLFRSLIRASCQYGSLGLEPDDDSAGAAVTGRDLLQHSVDLTNRYIATTHNRSSMFASMFFGVLDPASGELLYVNGGHESPMIFRAGGAVDRLEVTGGVLGLFPFARYGIERARLDPGDLLLTWTDGVNEAKDGAGGQFTEERIPQVLGTDLQDARDVLQRLLEAVKSFRGAAPQSDDITMLAVRRL